MNKKPLNNKYNEYIRISYILSILLLDIFFIEILYSHNIDRLYLPFFMLSLLLLTLFLSINIFEKEITTKPIIKDYLYLITYIGLIHSVIYFNISFNLNLIKFFYMIPVILYSAHYGKKFGIITAVCVVFSLATINHTKSIEYYVFDLDVVLIILLFWMAWLIGGFVDIERRIRDSLIQTASQLEKVNKELEESQELFRSNFEESNVGMVINDLEGVIIRANSAFLDMLGYKNEDLIGKNIYRLEYNIDPNGVPGFTQNLFDKDKHTLSITNKYIDNQGEIIWVNQNTTLVYDKNHQRKYYLNHIQNITETTLVKEKFRLQKEELEYNKLKTKFFANLSHELKTPINLIFSSLQILKLKNKEKKNDKYLNIIKQNSYRLLRLVNNIIDLTKIDVNSYQINLDNYDIVKVIKQIILSTQDYVESKQKYINFNTTLEKQVMACDPFSIERILLNLISNAVKFTNKGDLITISLNIVNNKLLIEVADTGIGIKPEKLAIIFDYFRQVDDSFSRRSEGSGIGLSLVRSLVELHDGEISVESKYGEGTVFYISLPIKTIENTDKKNNYQSSNYLDKVSLEFSDIYE